MQVLTSLFSFLFKLSHGFVLHLITFHFVDTWTMCICSRRCNYRGELASTMFNIFSLQALNYIALRVSKLSDKVFSCSLEEAELIICLKFI